MNSTAGGGMHRLDPTCSVVQFRTGNEEHTCALGNLAANRLFDVEYTNLFLRQYEEVIGKSVCFNDIVEIILFQCRNTEVVFPPRLRVLHIEHMPLETIVIPDQVAPHLEVLILKFTNMTTFPRLSHCPRLRTVVITHAKIERLPWKWSPPPLTPRPQAQAQSKLQSLKPLAAGGGSNNIMQRVTKVIKFRKDTVEPLTAGGGSNMQRVAKVIKFRKDTVEPHPEPHPEPHQEPEPEPLTGEGKGKWEGEDDFIANAVREFNVRFNHLTEVPRAWWELHPQTVGNFSYNRIKHPWDGGKWCDMKMQHRYTHNPVTLQNYDSVNIHHMVKLLKRTIFPEEEKKEDAKEEEKLERKEDDKKDGVGEGDANLDWRTMHFVRHVYHPQSAHSVSVNRSAVRSVQALVGYLEANHLMDSVPSFEECRDQMLEEMRRLRGCLQMEQQDQKVDLGAHLEPSAPLPPLPPSFVASAATEEDEEEADKEDEEDKEDDDDDDFVFIAVEPEQVVALPPVVVESNGDEAQVAGLVTANLVMEEEGNAAAATAMAVESMVVIEEHPEVRKLHQFLHLSCHTQEAHPILRISYAQLFALVWWAVVHHEERALLMERLITEVDESVDTCFTGCVNHLINTLVGFVEGVKITVSVKEEVQLSVQMVIRQFLQNQLRFSALRKRVRDIVNFPYEMGDEDDKLSMEYKMAWINAVADLRPPAERVFIENDRAVFISHDDLVYASEATFARETRPIGRRTQPGVIMLFRRSRRGATVLPYSEKAGFAPSEEDMRKLRGPNYGSSSNNNDNNNSGPRDDPFTTPHSVRNRLPGSLTRIENPEFLHKRDALLDSSSSWELPSAPPVAVALHQPQPQVYAIRNNAREANMDKAVEA